MMKKVVLILLILLLTLAFIWNKYSYLIQSVQNFPKSTSVPSVPTTLPPATSNPDLSFIHLPEGFTINYFARDVPGARSLARGDDGTIYVGTRPQGVVYALASNTRYVVASGLNNPNGVVYKDGDLYVAEIGRIIKFSDIDHTYDKKPKYSVIYDQLPKDTHHGWRYMALGPDDKLYLGLGAPCNNCETKDPAASIVRLDTNGKNFEIIARGIRNTVGFDWNQADNSLWFTDNGRDELGDDVPPDELNHLTVNDQNFGFPYCHAGTILDPQFGKGKNCSDYVSPALTLGPHVAALGMKFYRGDMFPEEYKSKMIIAEHGSWNRKTPIGYRLMSVDVSGGIASNYQVFADGWLGAGGKALGRPVDLLELPDDSVLVSDDFTGTIYRISYHAKN